MNKGNGNSETARSELYGDICVFAIQSHRRGERSRLATAAELDVLNRTQHLAQLLRPVEVEKKYPLAFIAM